MATAVTPLSFNEDFAAQKRKLFFDYQSYLNQLLRKKNDLGTNYATQVSDMNLEKPNVYRRLLNNYAGRGMAYSTGYGQARVDTDTNYAKQQGSLAAVRDAGLSDIAAQQTDYDQQYQYNLAELARQQAAAEAANRLLTAARK